MMAPYGITARMHETGLRVRHWQIRDRRGDLKAAFDLDLLADVTPYPYRLHLEQHRLTPIQLDILRQTTPAEVRFAHQVTGFVQHADQVQVEIANDGKPDVIAASWLIGADGGRSTVRKTLGVEFEGFTYPEQFLVASTPHDFGQDGFALNSYIADGADWAAVFKMPDGGPPGIWRAAFPADADLPDDALLDAERIEQRMQRLVPRAQPYEIRYKSIYRVHQRVAKTFREGRVLIAGDAAHLNNPLGGFGLNSGIHDAINLADKLGRVWRGESDALLDLYVRQRRSATVEQVQAMSAVQRQHLSDLVALANDPGRARQYLLDSSMISGLRRSLQVP
jgi:3-(3-hydroxy-phenyl)propionate hydroxylase